MSKPPKAKGEHEEDISSSIDGRGNPRCRECQGNVERCGGDSEGCLGGALGMKRDVKLMC